MKLGHAAALALVGWCLMLPTIGNTRELLHINNDMPYSRWWVFKAFPSEEECEHERANILKGDFDVLSDPANETTINLVAGKAVPKSEDANDIHVQQAKDY